MKQRRIGGLIALLVLTALCAGLLAGCGGSAKKTEPAEDVSFLLGSWFAESASRDGNAVDPDELFGGTFMLYFSENGDCTMSIDQKRAIVHWELNDGGLTLTGDDTYPAVFADESRKTMTVTVQGFDVLMEKYED